MTLDLFLEAMPDAPEWADAMEAMEAPPGPLEYEVYAVYWLLALAPGWTSCFYTFSDTLYEELARMPVEKTWKAARLWDFASEVRELHPEEVKTADTSQDPQVDAVMAVGLKRSDANHVADAIRLGASHFLTLDRRVLSRAEVVAKRWGLSVLKPSQFLLWSVRAGAPWPVSVPWPWEEGPLRVSSLKKSAMADS